MSIELQETINLTHTLCFLFSGKAGTGKSFACDLAMEECNRLGLKIIKTPFAYGVKNTARFMGWDGKKDALGRRLLQQIGAAGRAYDRDIWVKAALTYVEESVGYPYDAIFVDDWRFTNEILYIQKHQPLYRVIDTRIFAPNNESLLGTIEYLDKSETELDNFSFDFYVNNNNHPDISKQVKDIVNKAIRSHST